MARRVHARTYKRDGPVRSVLLTLAGIGGAMTVLIIVGGIYTRGFADAMNGVIGAAVIFGLPSLILWGIASLIPQIEGFNAEKR